MLNHLKYAWHVLTDSYFVEVGYTIPAPKGAISTVTNIGYVQVNADETTDFTNDICKASPFGIGLATIVVRNLREANKEKFPDFNFSLISVGDAAFIENVTGGRASNMTGPEGVDAEYVKGRKIAMDRLKNAVEELKDVMKIPGVHGYGSILHINTAKNTEQEIIEIAVSNEKARAQAISFVDQKNKANPTIPGPIPGTYKGYPIKVVIREQSKAL